MHFSMQVEVASYLHVLQRQFQVALAFCNPLTSLPEFITSQGMIGHDGHYV